MERVLEIKEVAVVGAGTMGHGIAQVLVRHGFQVCLTDAAEKFSKTGAERIVKGLARDVEKARMTEEERQQALGRLKTTTHLADLAAVDLVIEAVTEDFEVKAGVF